MTDADCAALSVSGPALNAVVVRGPLRSVARGLGAATCVLREIQELSRERDFAGRTATPPREGRDESSGPFGPACSRLVRDRRR